MDYVQAIIIGVLQGITELFPISSLGHSVILPKLLGWDGLVAAQAAPESFFLAFLVGLHVATALALLVFYRTRWAILLGALWVSLRRRQVATPDERVIWLLVIATVPAGLLGLILEHPLRVLFATPLVASLLLIVNGLILLAGERFRRRSRLPRTAMAHPASANRDRPMADMRAGEAAGIGIAQAAALLPGISRSGITMVAGLMRGLDHSDAAEFSFLLATPIILAAGLYKLPDLIGHNGDGVRGQVLVGSIAAGISAYLSARFLTRYFRTQTLLPFAIYCIVAGAIAAVLIR